MVTTFSLLSSRCVTHGYTMSQARCEIPCCKPHRKYAGEEIEVVYKSDTNLCKFKHSEFARVSQIERSNMFAFHQPHKALHLQVQIMLLMSKNENGLNRCPYPLKQFWLVQLYNKIIVHGENIQAFTWQVRHSLKKKLIISNKINKNLAKMHISTSQRLFFTYQI